MKSDWFQTNVADLKTQPDFRIRIRPYGFTRASLWDASVAQATELVNTHGELLLAYSGGMDSEFVLKVFHESKIPITPVIVHSPLNPIEIQYAIKFCRDRNIKYELLEITFEEYMRYVVDIVYKKIRGTAPFGIQGMLIADRFGKQVVTGYGDPFVVGGPLLEPLERVLEISEFDYYWHDPKFKPIPFFSYTQEVFYALIKDIDYNLSAQEAKSKIYGIPFRPKIKGKYSKYNCIVDEIRQNSDVRLGRITVKLGLDAFIGQLEAHIG
jgi:hypothetical protein